jgi:hypothetical protein
MTFAGVRRGQRKGARMAARVRLTGGHEVRPAACLAALVLVVAAGGCAEPNALLLTVSADRRVDNFDLFVRDQLAGQKIDEHLAVQLGSQDISQPGQELKIAERFSRPGTYLVHLVGRDATGLMVATRIFEVDGAVASYLKLVGLTSASDADGDGYPNAEACARLSAASLDCALADCDDHNPATNVFAVERCNGKDDDCDGVVPADEADADEDGFLACTSCDPSDADWNAAFFDCRDCDDTRADVHPASRRDPIAHPSATEDCQTCGDRIDHDCDGVTDEGCADHDCDGFMDCQAPGAPPVGLCDCDDTNAELRPGASETCGDKIDNNCDGQTDEGCMPCDVDGDGFLRAGTDCNPPAGQADCNDFDSGIFPGAADSCAGKEGGCREMALRGYCRYAVVSDPVVIHDCKNATSGISGCPPRACDHDGDGFMRYDPANGCSPAAALADCDDENPKIFPGAPDYCGNGIAENCNLDTPCSDDADGDHYNASEDCDDNDASVHPWAVEKCNGVDDDCDGLVDEGNPNSTTGATVTGVRCTDSDIGECGLPASQGDCVCSNKVPSGNTRNDAARHACPDENLTAAASPRCFGAKQKIPETAATCNGKDDNCDGLPDDAPGQIACLPGDACRNRSGTWKCACGPDTSCSGCCVLNGTSADACIPIGSVSVAQCGQSGAACVSCDDVNPCTTDSCDGTCHNVNLAEHTACPTGQCRLPASGGAGQCCGGCWIGTACIGSPAAGCGANGDDCAVVNTSCGTCKVCDGAGACGNVPSGQDTNEQCADDGAASCGKTGVCDGSGHCTLYAVGTACETCKICNGLGTCGNVPGGQDPHSQCADDGAASCQKTGVCDGNGACRLYASGTACALCKQCNGSGSCGNVPGGQDPNNQCADDGAASCQKTGACDGNGACQLYASGTRCATCKECNGTGLCNVNVAGNSDPHNDCTAEAQSTCGLTGSCNGAGACQLWAVNTDCGTCAECNGSGQCNVMPADDPACVVNCDGLDSICRNYDDLTSNRCLSVGNCKPANTTYCTIYNNASAGTDCALAGERCRMCDANGGCNQKPGDDADCGTITCSSNANPPCRTCTNMTSNRCKSFGNCWSASLADCLSSGSCTNLSGSQPGCTDCYECNGAGGCVQLPNGTNCQGSRVCCSGTCCPGGQTCQDGGVSCG